ncbi:MAG: valine--tRNA ligase [Coriobacteriia bacterium]|nr:valine--tRNA ligase [Coriobacteriia bacterium]
MSEMPKAYDPKSVEGPVLESWLSGGYFRQPVTEGAEPFTVVIPPPNVTGSLHMGHALNNTIQDVVVRRMRMTGRPTRWVVGTDHAGIATQNKVEQKLALQGLSRHDVGRERFVEMCWEWRREHGSTIIGQLKAMGCSCDYDDEHFTMDPGYRRAVRKVFVDWFEEGLVYRGERIINWCPRCATALSDIEVEHAEVDSALWHIRYPLAEPRGGYTHLVVATTRPETMLGDTCVAVHPEDERYRDVVGATVVLPLLGRDIPVVADDYVDPCFGTGAVKVTPAHDPNDFEIAERHGCEKVNVLAPDATVNENGGPYAGLDRFEARGRVVADLEAQGLLAEVEDRPHAVGHCYRCHTIVEPWLSDQWFVDMKPLAAPAIEAVRDGRVVFHPKRWEKVYFDWMENIRDWCVSRQLWWGHQIPVFYCAACGGKAVASMTDLEACPDCGGPVRQDEDVLDTWFSSQLWPFAVFGWPAATPELTCFYPTSVLSTARDILFLWVARMIMSGMHFAGDVPYRDVIIHPTVFNAEGKRMSKSLGTGIDPLDLMEHYGADGMRFGLMLQVTGSQDVRFSEEKLASSRNFANKIWNASRFVLMNLDGHEPGEPETATVADRWILSRLAEVAGVVDRALDVDAAREAGVEAYDFGEAARELYGFFWSEYCDWYIELAKGRLAAGAAPEATEEQREARRSAQRNLVFVLDRALRLLHPFMPYVTEEIWRRLPLTDADRAPVQAHAGEPSLMVAAWPAGLERLRDESAEASMRVLQELITEVRAVRARYGVPARTGVRLVVKGGGAHAMLVRTEARYLGELAGVSESTVDPDAERPRHAAAGVAGGMEVFVPLEGLVDFDRERARVSRELARVGTERAARKAKLDNERFASGAPAEVVEKVRAEEARLAAEERLLREQLEALE